ncbi:hypothetical protein [Allosphingosinicella deserti]|uniref:Uncharacterized protein n=1 Tax=Allosphingosinicella deserti TaxID=2116704 RepID=A0A2P7QVY3_9SPHN|nr:hypothetical protein [Sphingomonas deserti]PSJ42132.1 hypothetical protein C7I55_07820 [Sphingomonas deserti]
MAGDKDPIEIGFAMAMAEEFGFGDAVLISGIDARQLRNGLDRGVFSGIGRKLPSVGRWVFTLKDTLQLMLIGEFTNRVWMPVSQATEVARRIVASFDAWSPDVFENAKRARARESYINSEFVISNSAGSTEIMIHKRGTLDGGDAGESWGFYDLDLNRTDDRNMLEAHVRLSIFGVISRLSVGYATVLSERCDIRERDA